MARKRKYIYFLLFLCILFSTKVNAENKIETVCGQYYSNNKSIAKVLRNKGFDDIHIAGVIGNWANESHLNPSQLEIGGGSCGHGLMQVSNTSGKYWTLMLSNWNSIKDDATIQTAWLVENFAPEMWNTYNEQQFSDPASAARYFCIYLEGCPCISCKEQYACEWYASNIAEKKKKKEEAEKRRQEFLKLKTIEELHFSEMTVEDVKKNQKHSVKIKNINYSKRISINIDTLNEFVFGSNGKIGLMMLEGKK